MGEIRLVVYWVIPFLIFDFFFHSYIGGLLHLKYFYSLCWSHKLKSKIWWRSDHWLLAYSIFLYLRSSSNILLEVLFIWKTFIIQFGHTSLSLKFEEDQTIGCWDIPILIFEVFFHNFIGGRLNMKHFYSLVWSYKLKLKFGEDWTVVAEIFHF